MEIKNKTAIVTGGGRGIGMAIAQALAEKGASVVLAARTASEINAVAKRIGKKAFAVRTDITSEKSVKGLVSKTIAKFGGIDILINNAGTGFAKPILKTSAAEWDVAVDTNLKGTFLCSRVAAKEMIKRRNGAIINIASAAGTKGYANQAAYCASKHGVVGFSRVLALELKPYNIKVHTICPGGVDTTLIDGIRPDIPKKDLMKPRDIANLVVFLLEQPQNAVIEEVTITRFVSK